MSQRIDYSIHTQCFQVEYKSFLITEIIKNKYNYTTVNGIRIYRCYSSLTLDRIPNLGIVIDKKVYYISGSKVLFSQPDPKKNEFIFNVKITEPNSTNAGNNTFITIGKEFYFEKKYAAIDNEEGKIMVFNKKPEYYYDSFQQDLNKKDLQVPLNSFAFAALIIAAIFIVDTCLFLFYWIYKKKKIKGKFLEVLNS